MEYELCTCLTESNLEKCLKAIEKIETKLIEHRIDYLKNINSLIEKENYCLVKNCLAKIYLKFNEKEFIVTCRNIGQGGKFLGSESQRINILINAIEAGANFVDIEIETEKVLIDKIISKAREKNCKVIISMHDFKKTPSFEKLLEIMALQKSLGADIGKIVCMPKNIENCNILLNLLIEAKKINFPLISFGMGEIGKFTRPVSLIYGSPFTFVSFNKASAPGQLIKEDIELILNMVKL
jgi:3-dehydroquinate dehydratase I